VDGPAAAAAIPRGGRRDRGPGAGAGPPSQAGLLGLAALPGLLHCLLEAPLQATALVPASSPLTDCEAVVCC
jgi:hypothetical protein